MLEELKVVLIMIASILMTGCKEITTLDLRYAKQISVKKYIKKYDPNIVVVAYNPSSFQTDAFDFFR